MAHIVGTGTREDYVERGVRGAVRLVVDEGPLDARDRARIARAWVDVQGEVIVRRRGAGDVEAWRFAGDITVTVVRLPLDVAEARGLLLQRCDESAQANA